MLYHFTESIRGTFPEAKFSGRHFCANTQYMVKIAHQCVQYFIQFVVLFYGQITPAVAVDVAVVVTRS